MPDSDAPRDAATLTVPSPTAESVTPAPVPAPRWTGRLLALGEVLLCSGLPTQLVVQLAAVSVGVHPWQAPGVPTMAFLAVTQLADACLLIALMTVLTRLHGDRPGLLWRGTRPLAREAGLGVLLIPAVLLLVGLTLGLTTRFAPWLRNVPENPFEQLISTPGRAALMVVVVIVAGGVREELQRAFLLRRFEQHLGGAGVGVIVLSAAFGAGHYVQGWDAMLATGVVGAFWAILYLRRRSVIAPVVSHAGFDVIQVLGTALT